MKPGKSVYLFLVIILFTTSRDLFAGVQVTGTRTEYKTDPLGIDKAIPRVSWILQSDEENTMQDSYQVRAALVLNDLNRGRNLIWNTDWVGSSRSVHIPYEGEPLQSFQRVYWQVRVKDNHGNRSPWSEPSYWETGFLPGTGWKAAWISPTWQEDPEISNPAPYLRKEFSLGKKVRSARLYISSLGLYQAEINGKRVGDQEFTPGWTSYSHRVQYQTYDVTGYLNSSGNVLGIILGDGWYRGNLAWLEGRNVYGRRLAAIVQMVITYSDGTQEIIVTDQSWKASKGPILSSDIYNGEAFDATREMPGWSQWGFDDKNWSPVEVVDAPKSMLIAPEGPPVRVVNELSPVTVHKRGEGWLVDMGQNMVGWIRIRASGNPGDVITIRHAEVLDKEGKIYYDNLRKAKQTDTYRLKGNGQEVFEPHFTFHGFRYLMITGYRGELTKDAITGRVIHSDMDPAGSFSCSDPLINQLQHNILWGLKGNFLDVPTDCPQRDERLGWTGDAQVFAPTACFNMNAAGFYKKWLKDLALDQAADGGIPHVIPDVLRRYSATGWADAGVVIPWVVYQEYGDATVLEDQYESMRKWIGYMEGRAGEDLIWSGDPHYGDWLSFDDSKSDYMGAYTSKDLIATAYFAYSSALVSKVAGVLGREEERAYLADLSERVRTAFNKEFVTPNGRLASHTQTAYTLALAFGLLDEETAWKSARFLAGDVEDFGHITTGFLGTPLISQTLTDIGRIDLAYRLLNRKEYPSWLYPVTMGATTIWERWDGQKPDSTFQNKGMNSFNHYAYGAIGKWMYQVVAGIGPDPDQPGYKHVIIHPRPGGGLTYAEASHTGMYGEIASRWELDGDNLTMEVHIPPNSSASIHIPGQEGEILINGKTPGESGMEIQEEQGGIIALTGSGSYRITTQFINSLAP